MIQSSYQKRFSRLVRWRLPRAEAEGVLADYEEIFAHHRGEDDAALTRSLGEPRQAVGLLTQPGAYRRWLAAFAWMAFCLLLPLVLLLRGRFWSQPTALMAGLLLTGMAVSLAQFRPRARRGPMPRGLRPALAGLAVLLATVGWVLGCLFTGAWTSWPAEWYGLTAWWVLCLTGAAGAAAGLLGVVKARLDDRRWSALYILGLTAVAVCVLILAFLTSLDSASGVAWASYALPWGLLGAAGLVGTGVALC